MVCLPTAYTLKTKPNCRGGHNAMSKHGRGQKWGKERELGKVRIIRDTQKQGRNGQKRQGGGGSWRKNRFISRRESKAVRE